MSYHIFNIEVAKAIGPTCATFIENIKFWTKTNLANRQNIKDGSCWTYNSLEAFLELFPYLTMKQLRGVIERCEENDFIKKSNYNRNNYDRTCWYALTEKAMGYYPDLDQNLLKPAPLSICPKGQMDLSEGANGSVQKGTPIPDVISDVITDAAAKESEVDRVESKDLESLPDLKAAAACFVISEELDRDLLRFNQSPNFKFHAKDNREFLFWCKYCLDERIKADSLDGKVLVLKSWIRRDGGLTKPVGYGQPKATGSKPSHVSGRGYAPEHAHQSSAYTPTDEVIEKRDKNIKSPNIGLGESTLASIQQNFPGLGIKLGSWMDKTIVNLGE